MRTAFFGTPEIAVPALRALHELSEVVLVVCQPDRPAGRGLELRAPAVKQAALEVGLPVSQPLKVRDGSLEAQLRAAAPDVALVMAYGRILPLGVLQAPRLGCLNLHASILPRHRGAAPIQWAIAAGDAETGIALMQMEEGLDTGPVYATHTLQIGPTTTGGTLHDALAELGAVVVRTELPRFARGELVAVPQDDARATHAPPILREHLRIDWSWDAPRIERLVRAMAPRPGATFNEGTKAFRLLGAALTPERVFGPAGRVSVFGKRLLVAVGEPSDGKHAALELMEAQQEGRKVLAARDLVNGRALQDGALLGASPGAAP